MNKIDWAFWAIIAVLIVLLLSGIFTPGCAALQRRETPTVAPKPAVQMWQAAKDSNWIVTISILGMAGGVFATLNGQKWGMAVIVSCSVALFMSLAVARFAWWMAVCGLLGSVGLCVVSIMSRKRALVEIIKGVEKLKEGGASDREHVNVVLALEQKSKSTRGLIQNIKADLKIKGEIE